MVTSPCDFYQPRQQRRKARSGKPAILIHISANARADAPAEGEPLRRTTADAKNHQKMAADAFPAFEKYKEIENDPPTRQTNAEKDILPAMSQQQHPNNSKQHSALTKMSNMLPWILPFR